MKSQCIILYVERNIFLPVTSASTWGCFKTNSYIKIGVYVYMSWWVFLLNMHKKCWWNILLQMLKFIFILLKNATYYSKSTWIHDDKFGKCFDILRFRKFIFQWSKRYKFFQSHKIEHIIQQANFNERLKNPRMQVTENYSNVKLQLFSTSKRHQ